MARAIWSGAISFGLVNVPVKMHTAVRQKEVRFHMLHDEDGARIQQRRVCSSDGEEVEWEHIAKGYEVSRGRYVMVKPEELEALDPKATRTIDIAEFVDPASIDPIFFESTYYLVPDKGAERAYALLHDAMERLGRVGIGRVVIRTKQYLCTLRPAGRALAMSTMQYADEVVSVDDLEGLPDRDAKPRERERELAEQLVQALSADFEPEKYKDEYRDRVLDLLQRKAEGEEIVAAPAPELPARTVNLMDALKASLAAPRGAERPPARAAARRRTKRATGARKRKGKAA